MSNFINYLIEANLALIMFMAVYAMFLKNENQFSFNRFFLLGGIVLSVLLPLVHFDFSFLENVAPTFGQAIPTYWLPTIGTQESDTVVGTENFISISSLMKWGYVIIVTIFSLIFIFRILKLLKLILRSKKYSRENCFVAESKNNEPTFSFFNFIFIGQIDALTPDEKEKILQHELVHVQRMHSFDVLIINIIGIICWFNPIVALYKKTLIQLHEFEADACSVRYQDADLYCQLMAKVALQEAGFSLVNHFHTSLTIKRIAMMNTLKRKIKNWKLVALALVVPFIFIVISCQEQVMNDVQNISKNAVIVSDMLPEIQAKLDALKKENPGADYTVIELNEEGLKTLAKLEQSQAGGNHFSVSAFNTYDKTTGKIDRSFAFLLKGNLTNQISSFTITEDSVYTLVDNIPTYPGGLDSLSADVQRNLSYPLEAKTKGVEGKVYIEFIVEKNGKVTTASVAKGINPLCDQEALRVVSGLRPWIPGTQQGRAVRVKFMMPINFKLG